MLKKMGKINRTEIASRFQDKIENEKIDGNEEEKKGRSQGEKGKVRGKGQEGIKVEKFN